VTGGSRLTLYSLQQYLSYFALAAVAVAAWGFLVVSEQAMRSMRGDGLVMDMMWAMMDPSAVLAYVVAATVMWVVMMVAMMVPAALPMTMVFRGMQQGHHATTETLLFASGYLLVWSFFAVIGAGLQWGLHISGDLRGHLLEVGPLTAAGILVAAGVYQLTPFKEACLARCRSPMGFFVEHWQDGRYGAIAMGLRHGLYCLGCCWMLMLLMFVGGAMSVSTMAVLSIFILTERLLPAGPWVSRLPAFVLLVWGVTLMVGL
jgi:predicted metal-binding membrane protein